MKSREKITVIISCILMGVGFLILIRVIPLPEWLTELAVEGLIPLFSGSAFIIAGLLIWIVMALSDIRREIDVKQVRRKK